MGDWRVIFTKGTIRQPFLERRKPIHHHYGSRLHVIIVAFALEFLLLTCEQPNRWFAFCVKRKHLQPPTSKGDVNLPHLSEIQILRFLTQFALLFLTARALGDLMKRLGQATVIGELLAGILLGPSLLGHAAPIAYRLLFPADPLSDHLLEVVAWIGLILLLLYTGLETDPEILLRVGRTAITVSWLGIAIPWVSGFALGWMIPAAYLAHANSRLIFALFIAVAMSISAVPVIAKILIDLDLMRRDLGLVILAAGILDDTLGWLMLSIIAGLAAHGAIDVKSLISILVAVSLFVLFCYYVAANLVVRMMRWVDDLAIAEHAGITTMVGLAVICAIVTQAIGIHAVFGAFVAGTMLGRSARVRQNDRDELEAATIGVFAPLFFAYSGLKVDIFALQGVGVLTLVLAIAILGKVIGCTAGSLVSGLNLRESLAVGVGMNARGGMEIIVALIGLSLGVLSSQMYAIIIIVAIVTSMMTPPLLSWLLSQVGHRPGEAERLQRENLLARLPFNKQGAKLLVLSGGGPHALLATHIAAALANHPDASITVFRVVTADQDPKSAKFSELFERIKALAELSGVRNVHQRSMQADSVADAVIKESERGYDAIFAGASRVAEGQPLGGGLLRELVDKAMAPVVIARSGADSAMPLRRVLAPTTGAPFSRLGATIAMLYAHSTRATLTTLYVREVPLISLRGLYLRSGSRARFQSIETHDELKAYAQEFEVSIDTQVATGNRPETAILAAAERGKFDLLVMGVLFRSSEEHLYFGPKVEHI
ncbi:MAG TPA: cation:proton antiporter, partial [Candidatus Binataceae bacterium]|nr:cation:proton antiporter [Candidatus Binataceae bacterium]